MIKWHQSTAKKDPLAHSYIVVSHYYIHPSSFYTHALVFHKKYQKNESGFESAATYYLHTLVHDDDDDDGDDRQKQPLHSS